MDTTEILKRLYGVRQPDRRRWQLPRRVRAWKRRTVDWIRNHNWSLILVALGFALWFLTHIYYYNNLVSLEFDVAAARAQIEATQQKRSHIQRNVVSLLRFYEGYERDLMTSVTDQRTRGDVPPSPSDSGSDDLGALIGRLHAVAEAYPALQLQQVVQRFVEAVIAIESEIALRISQYNSAVNVYTTVIRQFPGFLFAHSLGFEEPTFYQPPDRDSLPYQQLTLPGEVAAAP